MIGSQQWEKDWLMSFNPDKCEVIRITNKKKIIDAKYTIHGQVLHETNRAKYLDFGLMSTGDEVVPLKLVKNR
jgi:hypothetical protein